MSAAYQTYFYHILYIVADIFTVKHLGALWINRHTLLWHCLLYTSLEKLKSSAAAEQKKSKEITEQLKAESDQLEKDKEKELQDDRSKAASIIEEVRFQGDLMLEELERLRKQK